MEHLDEGPSHGLGSRYSLTEGLTNFVCGLMPDLREMQKSSRGSGMQGKSALALLPTTCGCSLANPIPNGQEAAFLG